MDKETSNKEPMDLPTRVDKTLQWLKVSRDSWKEKTKESKAKLKITTLGLKRARDDRDQIEMERHHLQAQLKQRDAELVLLKNKLNEAAREIENLKKKR
jgi:truncated hemoglobin YjbI